MYDADPAQPLTTAGEEPDDLVDHYLSDLSVRGVNRCHGVSSPNIPARVFFTCFFLHVLGDIDLFREERPSLYI